MRVIGGMARGHKLKMVPGDTTRPITDRVKENLFNILGDWVINTRWLDLFAGTGQVGIEALSRNAEHAVFVDTERNAVRTIRANLDHTRLAQYATVIQRDAFSYLRSSRSGQIDVIYVAPPQYKGLWKEVVLSVDTQTDSKLKTEGLLIAQINPVEFEVLELEKLQLSDQRKYGRTMLCFYEIKSNYSTST
jgi:16S rRNA (guanine966-N2)-methyltransferase